jgi:hypothetical protein
MTIDAMTATRLRLRIDKTVSKIVISGFGALRKSCHHKRHFEQGGTLLINGQADNHTGIDIAVLT